MALEELHNIINSQMNAYPEGAVIIAGDFNRTDLKTVMPEYILMYIFQPETRIYLTKCILISQELIKLLYLHTLAYLIIFQ